MHEVRSLDSEPKHAHDEAKLAHQAAEGCEQAHMSASTCTICCALSFLLSFSLSIALIPLPRFPSQNPGSMTVVQIEERKDNRQLTPGQMGDEMSGYAVENMLRAGTGATKTIPGTTGPEKVCSNMTRERTQAL